MSADPSPSKRPPLAACADGARDTLTIFVTDALAVAEATDPMLAELLAGMLGDARAERRATPFRGDRREGLELCRRLLQYVRQDVCDRRLDVSLGYIAGELSYGSNDYRPEAAH